MRSENHIGKPTERTIERITVRKWLFWEDINRRTAKMTRADRCSNSSQVHYMAARKIDKQRARSQFPQFTLANQIVIRSATVNMHGNHIRLAKKFRE